MKRFVIKFLVVILLFFVPVSYYAYCIKPNMSGDIGTLGMIPFGKEYGGLNVPDYQRNTALNCKVVSVSSADSISRFNVITIGDSFSQQREYGYQWKLSGLLGCPIANYFNRENNVFNRYMTLLNAGYINSGQTVIVESVERYLIYRLSDINFDNQSVGECVATESKIEGSDNSGQLFLYRFFSWVRLKLNINNPTAHFDLSKKCFEHPHFGNRLYIYNSQDDGDLHFNDIDEVRWSKALENLQRLYEVSESRGINLVVMIASDKYDAYQPWIVGEHSVNHTLERIPIERFVFDTKPCLQKAIDDDVLDVYKIGDTHWSVVGADIVADNLYKWIRYRE